MSDVLCDRKVQARRKGKVFKTVVRAAVLFGLKTVAQKRSQEAEPMMLRFSLGVTRVETIRNEDQDQRNR